ncbi:MAG: TolB family protein [Candidatus Brachytrichaceae bacterium NZ_4S206]
MIGRTIRRIILCACVYGLFGHVASAAATSPQTRPQTSPPNLVQNAGFEQLNDNSWESCGDVRLVDAQSAGAEFVHTGRYAAFMGAGADGNGCPTLPDTTTPKQILTQQLNIPANAPAVTVSFWFRAFAGTTVDVFLAQGFYQFDPNLGGVRLGTFSTDQPPGWQLYRTVLQGERLERVRGQTLRFSIVIQGNTGVGPDAVLLIDDVQVIAADGRTMASPLPAALRGDGSRPLAVTRVDNNQRRWLYRMDTDGGNVQLIYRGLLDHVRSPAWSPNGQRIAVVDNNLWPWPTPDPDPQNNLSASALTVLNADGSGAQQIYQTQSTKGSSCPFIPLPGETEKPSLILRASNVQWMPDNARVAFTQVAFNQFCDGSVSGGLADILLVAPPSLLTTPLAQFATRPSISRDGRMLFDGFDLSSSRSNRADGVWERDPGGGETRLIASNADRAPAWAPDGRRFAVVRVTTSPSSDVSDRTFAIMIYERQNLDNPRMVLFADHGRTVSNLSWSPNGAYLVYSLERFDGRTDIWWLDVATGATGPVTTDGSALEASWRPGAQQQRVYVPLAVR